MMTEAAHVGAVVVWATDRSQGDDRYDRLTVVVFGDAFLLHVAEQGYLAVHPAEQHCEDHDRQVTLDEPDAGRRSGH